VLTSEAQGSFDKLKEALTSPPVLVNPDFSRKFYVHCDSSDFGIRAVLVKLSAEWKKLPIYFFSKILSSAQRNWSVTEHECCVGSIDKISLLH